MAGRNGRRPHTSLTDKGFTIIELIIVIVSMAILAVSVTYKAISASDTAEMVAADQLLADMDYVQMRAMGVGSPQGITFTAGSGVYNVPGEQKRLPGDVVVTSTTLPSNALTFNSLGEPTFTGTSDGFIYLSGGGSGRTIKVYALTGRTE